MKLIKKLSKTPIIGLFFTKIIKVLTDYHARNMATHFSEYLQPIKATNSYIKEQSFNVRHQVYCEELNFEPLRKNKLETDEFDDQSIHCVIQHRRSQLFAGTVRVVCSASEEELLPIEKYCRSSITNEELRPENFPRNKICEISRLAIPESFRRRKADDFKGAPTGVINERVYSEKELRCFPFIAVGLYLSAANIVIKEGIEHVFVMMEPRLARSLRLVGINFVQLGPIVNYHGKRAPYYITPKALLESLSPGLKKLFYNIESDLNYNDPQLGDESDLPAEAAYKELLVWIYNSKYESKSISMR